MVSASSEFQVSNSAGSLGAMRSCCNRNEDDDGNDEAFAMQVTRKGFRRIVCVASYIDHIHTRTPPPSPPPPPTTTMYITYFILFTLLV